MIGLYFASLLWAYFLGAIPFGLLIPRWVMGMDIRQHGSGNIGATNVFRVAGKKWGLLVLALDTAKGCLAIGLPVSMLRWPSGLPFPLILGLAVILGHSFPAWLSFKGGKGVATSLGVFLYITPIPTLMTFGIWILCFALSRTISLASLAAALIFPIVVTFFHRNEEGFAWLASICILLTLFIFYTHRSNIRRLLRGEEKRLI